MVNSFSTPSVFAKHVAMVNFSKHGLPTPIYVNIVRDPVERVISWFYYSRAAWYIVDRIKTFPKLKLPTSAWIQKVIFDNG